MRVWFAILCVAWIISLFKRLLDALIMNWPLVAIGLPGVWIALKTLGVIQKQTEALMRSERAWLVFHPSGFKLQPQCLRLDWKLSNTGRTTARIVDVKLQCKKLALHRDLPEVPIYTGDPITYSGTPLPPNNSLDVWTYIDRGDRDYDALSAEDIADIREKGAELVAYGFVKYEDSFGKPHESRFCYYYAVPFEEFRIDLRASAEYHKCD